MRFHIGFSKFIKPSTILKILAIGFAAALAFLGFSEHAFAQTFEKQPVNAFYYNRAWANAQAATLSGDTSSWWYSVSNPGFNSYNFNHVYNLNNTCQSNKGDVIFSYYMYHDSALINDGLSISVVYDDGDYRGISGFLTESWNGHLAFKATNVDLTRPIRTIVNQSDTTGGQTITLVAGFKTLNIDCITSDAQIIIDNNNQNTQQIIDSQQQINDSITSDDVSGVTDNASDLFDDVDVSEPVGLTSVITAPIRLLQKLLDGGTCDAYSFDITMNNTTKSVSLPSGCILWNNVPGAIIAIYHVTIFGLLGYRLLIDMVHFVNDLRDPDKKNDYTLDL